MSLRGGVGAARPVRVDSPLPLSACVSRCTPCPGQAQSHTARSNPDRTFRKEVLPARRTPQINGVLRDTGFTADCCFRHILGDQKLLSGDGRRILGPGQRCHSREHSDRKNNNLRYMDAP